MKANDLKSAKSACDEKENTCIDITILSPETANNNETSQCKRHPGYGETPEGMSRSQFKKMKKAEMREKTHKEWRTKIREKEREKKKLKKQAIREGLVTPPVYEKVLQEPSTLRVVLDMSFDALMNDKELSSVGRQIQHCYSDNRRAKHPVGIHVTSHTEKIKEWFDTKAKESVNWQGIDFHEKPYEEVFAKEDLVYLTADSDNVISTLDETKVYIIGGIVDKNRHKVRFQIRRLKL
ncbi:tRNA methyltransferase 10, variant 2 [Entomophthora muscae]|uniref:tRNA methyltransferase 10, variant 2 n=1 Tax=Entomophthora muscae TaxID=34485 RepID=A0ACC2TLA8_9FUNG|nr:tRNA methyltransferase 10, variant 2 [Entomophthora muscae]